jgi:hypothetical protein
MSGSYVRRKSRPVDHYTQVSNTLLRDRRISPKAKGIAAWLLSHSETYRFSTEAIAEQLGVGQDQVKSGLRELEEFGYLERLEIREHGRMLGMEYVLDDNPQVETVGGKSTDGSSTGGRPGGLEEDEVPEDQPGEDEGEISLDLGLPVQASNGDGGASKTDGRLTTEQLDDEFRRWYDAYPRKASKQSARRSFERVRRRGAEFEVLLAGAQRYARERAGQDKAYTKHPDTWLNKGCWDDEATPVGAGRSNGYVPYRDADYWGPQKQVGDRDGGAV